MAGDIATGDIESDGLRLSSHLARPPRPASEPPPGLVLCHGFPPVTGSATAGHAYPELATRLAAEAGWTVLTFTFRGCGSSEGDFSLAGWLADIGAAVDHLMSTESVSGVWVAGAGMGGSLAICRAGEDDRVRGVAGLSIRVGFDDWAADPDRLLEEVRRLGAVRDPDFPSDRAAWARELSEIRPAVLAGKLSPRPLLLVHGADDDLVPPDTVRSLADAHGQAELRVLPGAGHRLRHDPRAVAVLLGWLERQAAS